MIPSSPLFAPLLSFLCLPLLPLPLIISVSLRFVTHCVALFHQSRWWKLICILIWSICHIYLSLLSIPVCLSKDVTGALVCSRGHRFSSFIIVRFILRHMPGSYPFRSLHQLVATVGFVYECQLRCNRSGRMVSMIPVFHMCCPVESLAFTKVASAMKPSARTRALAVSA